MGGPSAFWINSSMISTNQEISCLPTLADTCRHLPTQDSTLRCPQACSRAFLVVHGFLSGVADLARWAHRRFGHLHALQFTGGVPRVFESAFARSRLHLCPVPVSPSRPEPRGADGHLYSGRAPEFARCSSPSSRLGRWCRRSRLCVSASTGALRSSVRHLPS